ncbi:MAG: UDP-N-acetylmuramoyl-L-alanine--D-glutamate ligase, partial [Gammaproteobacteria bacterium]|nr:UDP-N-acetylmuramoyl-L-alanine--D-glutamate ligase [Gammaproteobacteria bacterium]
MSGGTVDIETAMNENEILNPGDAPAPAPGMEMPEQTPVPEIGAPSVGTTGRGGHRPLPETLTAARDAAAFVAQLFADASTQEPMPPAGPTAEELPPPVAVPGADEEAAPVMEPASETLASSLQGQAVLVLGLGASGLAMARWCARLGAHVTVADTREAPPQLVSLQAELPQAGFRAGAFESTLVEGSDIRAVFKSPGLSPAMVEPVWQAARA